MTNTQTGPYPVLFAKNTTRARINLHTRVGGTHFRRSLGPGETKEVPWVIAKSAGFHRLWTEGKLEVSDKFDFETTLDELPSIGADGGPTQWEEIEGVPEEFTPADHTRSWDEIDDKPTTFPPESHNHSWGQITGKPNAFTPSSHEHTITQVTNLQAALDGKAPYTHTHTTAQVDGLDAALADKVDDSDPRLSDARTPVDHDHDIAEVNGLQSALNGKAASSHTHTWAQIDDKPTTFAPATHTHAWADITGKPTIPDAAPVAEDQADSTATDVTELVADFNSLLAKLRAAGIIEES